MWGVTHADRPLSCAPGSHEASKISTKSRCDFRLNQTHPPGYGELGLYVQILALPKFFSLLLDFAALMTYACIKLHARKHAKSAT